MRARCTKVKHYRQFWPFALDVCDQREPMLTCVRLWLVLAYLAGFAFVLPPVALAQDAREVRDARRQFQQGVQQAKQGDWAAAVRSFEQAYLVTKEPSALFNLAGAQLRVGHMLESNANYHRFLLLRDPRIGSAHRTAAEQQLAQIERRIPRLRLQVDGLEPEDRVIVDKQRLYAPDLGLDQWLNPGVHVITVYRHDGDAETRRLTVLEGEHKTLSIGLR